MKTKVALAAAIILGMVAMVGVRTIIETYRQKNIEQRTDVTVLVAARSLPEGTAIMPKHVNRVPRPAASVPRLALTARDFDSHRGRPLRQKVREGDILLSSHFWEAGEHAKFESEIQGGERAVTIAVDQITGVAGLLLPGSRVDVLATFAVNAGGMSAQAQTNFITRTLLSHVRILAVDQQTSPGERLARAGRRTGGTYSSVTLAVSPSEAQILTLAQSQGQGMLTLTLRNPTDNESTVQKVKPVDMMSINEAILEADRERRARTPKTKTQQEDIDLDDIDINLPPESNN